MEDRGKSLATNEAWFREINDQIERRALEHGSDADLYEFVCECSDIDCTDRLQMTLGDYERVRAHPARFAIAPGHEEPEIEAVVWRDGFWVVEKKGPAAGHVAHRDTRP